MSIHPRNRMRPAVAALVLVASALVATSTPAVAGADPAGTITYQHDLSYLPGATLRTQQGTHGTTGGCQFDDHDRRHVSEGPRVLVFTEVSFDPKSCTRQVAGASYAPDAVPPAIARRLAAGDTAGGERKESATTQTGRDKKADAGTSALYYGSGYLQVWYEDIIGIDLSLTRSTLGWQWSDPDLLLYGGSYHEAYWYWQTFSGWRLNSSNREFYDDGSLTATDTIGHFSNPIFCLGDTTYSDHYQTLFYAANYGYWGWSYIVDKHGGCSGDTQMPGFYSWAITVA
jgi:hypothetical protein